MRPTAMTRAGKAWSRATALAFLLALTCAPPASAQTGSGLYEPFPEPAARSQAQDYLQELLLRPVSAEELDNGSFLSLPPTAPRPKRTAGERAGAAGAGNISWLDLPATVLLASILLAATALSISARSSEDR